MTGVQKIPSPCLKRFPGTRFVGLRGPGTFHRPLKPVKPMFLGLQKPQRLLHANHFEAYFVAWA